LPTLSLTEAERVRIARASLSNLGRAIVEYALFPFLTAKDASRWLEIEGGEHVDKVLHASGARGAIFLGLHLGNGDFAIGLLSLAGWPMNLISKEFKAKWLNDLWFGMRKRLGTKFISHQKSSFDILRALKRNEIVIFVLDQYMGPPIGVRTQFFGHTTGTAMGLALMADRTHAPVIPCYTYRKADGKHVAVFDKPIEYLDNGPRQENIATMTQVYTDKIEEIVRKHPEQWMWIHRRWKEFRDQ
jgi:KDO2-lipid IV(A) lauroyltransferase